MEGRVQAVPGIARERLALGRPRRRALGALSDVPARRPLRGGKPRYVRGPTPACSRRTAQDEDAGRRKSLRETVKELPLQPVIAIAIQEFEAWLIGDIGAVNRALGATFDTPPAPETMKRREAKSLLAKWIGDRGTHGASGSGSRPLAIWTFWGAAVRRSRNFSTTCAEPSVGGLT